MEKKSNYLSLDQCTRKLVRIKKEFAFTKKSVFRRKKIRFTMFCLWFSIVFIMAKLVLKFFSFIDKFRSDGAEYVSMYKLCYLLQNMLYRVQWFEQPHYLEDEEEEE